MDKTELDKLLSTLVDGTRTPDSVASEILNAKTTELVGEDGHVDVRVDHERANRCGFAEVIFSQGKTPEQTARIATELIARHPLILATRAGEAHHRAVLQALSSTPAKVVYHATARIIEITSENPQHPKIPDPVGSIVIASAGTSDLPVAEEAALCAEAFGANVERLYDIGVAGVHRALEHTDTLRRARVVIAVAGMEGALPSLIAGLVDVPIVAVPTSVGYGANLAGFAPLLSMLNSCASGIGVVNIDNGFGAAVLASRINNPTH